LATEIINRVLIFDFTEPDWRTKYPDIYTVTDSNGFYTASTFKYNDADTLRSYGISHNGTSQTDIEFTMLQDGVLSLNYTVSSEPLDDGLSINIDGIKVVHKTGTVSWTDYTKELEAGTHTLSLKYTKDGYKSIGSDAGAIGYLTISGVAVPCDTRYLIRSDTTLYTVVDGVLSALATTDIVAQTFLDYGIEDMPDGALLVGLSNPEILYWQDGEDDLPTLTAIVTATPTHQTIMSQAIDLMHSSIKGIDSITVDCKGDVLFAVSFDNKATWMMHNGTDWVDVADELTGMTKLEFEAITTEQWQTKYELSSNMYIRCTLTDATQSITSVDVSFIN
jgi:hypothetical protein